MHPDDLKYPAAFFEGNAYFFERSDQYCSSWFGGPLDVVVSGIEHGPRRLHHIATLSVKDLPRVAFPLKMPLLYGMTYSGCSLRYRSQSHGRIELLELEPTTSCEDFPYTDYPVLLPYIPLRVARVEPCEFKVFSELSCQPDWQFDPSSLIVLVPPSPVLGMSLWGPSGDAECAQIVFECDVTGGIIRAFNQCG